MCAMGCGVLGAMGVEVEKEQSYQGFKETWGLPKGVESTKEVL